MDVISVVVQVAEAMLSATSSKAAQRGCPPVILVITAGIIVATIIDNPNREELWFTQCGRKETPEKLESQEEE